MTGFRTTPILIVGAIAAALACAPKPPQPRAETRVERSPAAQSPAARPTAQTVQRRTNLPRATMPDGTVILLELALTPEEITRGLMYRPSLAEDRGMLFVFPHPRHPSFWMLNTWIPLDMVFLDASGVVIHVVENARPCPSEPCPKYEPDKPTMAVLEVNGGAAARLGLDIGARVEFARVPGYPVAEPD